MAVRFEMRELADRTAAAMSVQKYTQAALAESAGLPRSQISKILGAKHEPRLGTVIRLSDALGVRLDWLLGHESPKRTGGVERLAEDTIQVWRRTGSPTGVKARRVKWARMGR